MKVVVAVYAAPGFTNKEDTVDQDGEEIAFVDYDFCPAAQHEQIETIVKFNVKDSTNRTLLLASLKRAGIKYPVRCVWVNRLWVSKENRQSGIGRKLIDGTVKGDNTLLLLSIGWSGPTRPDMSGVQRIAVYERLGFTIVRTNGKKIYAFRVTKTRSTR